MIERLKAWCRRWLARWFGHVVAPVAPQGIDALPVDVLPFDPSEMVVRLCFNGPCQGAEVHAPKDATPGTACALGWQTVQGQPRFAVYVLVDYNGTQGLMFLKSYDRPEHAQAKVHRITSVVAGGMS